MSYDYHRDYGRISKSMLSVFRRSRLEFDLMYNQRKLPAREPTPDMLRGTVGHALIEGTAAEDVVAIYPDDCYGSGGSLVGKRAAEFRDAIAPKIALKASEFAELLACYESVRVTQLGEAAETAMHKEQPLFGERDGLPIKCKPDIVCDMGDYALLYDLKFSKDVSPSFFTRSCRRFEYWLQDAHYSHIAATHYGKPVQFRFAAIQTVPPYRVQFYWYNVRSREIARDAWASTLADLQECQKSGDWRDNWPNEIEIAPWELDGHEQLVEFGEDE